MISLKYVANDPIDSQFNVRLDNDLGRRRFEAIIWPNEGLV